MICYKAGDGTGEIAVEDRKEAEVGLLASQASVVAGFPVESVFRCQHKGTGMGLKV